MTGPEFERAGTGAWAQSRLTALSDDQDWTTHPACLELIDWLYTVVRHRAGALGLPSDVRAEVAQDAMSPIVGTLHRSRDRIAVADNPAAVLERVASRAVAAGRHRARMAGLAGVPANGRHWRAKYPTQVGGDAAVRVFEALAAPVFEPCRAVEDTAARLDAWVCEHVGVVLSAAAVDAVVYVLDRLVAGVGRAALVRGGHSGLAVDPAMRHLGFDAASAAAFGCWLLGRHDAEHHTPAVLDAFLDGDKPGPGLAESWRKRAVRSGFAAGREHDDATHGARRTA